MNAMSLEAVDCIIAAMCEGSNVDDLVPPDLDKAALALELGKIREDYKLRLEFDDLPTRAIKKRSIDELNKSARRFKKSFSKFRGSDPAAIDLLKKVASHDRSLVEREYREAHERKSIIAKRLATERLDEKRRSALKLKLKESVDHLANAQKRMAPYRDAPRFNANALDRIERDIDAIVRWTELLWKINEAPKPKEGSLEERELGHLRFDGWHDLSGDETLRWLIADTIPRLLREFFGRGAKASRGADNIAKGPSIRFAQAVLHELGVFSPKTGKPLTAYAIEEYWKPRPHQESRSEKNPHP